VRALGARLGLLLTALFGGLSSSTAVTVAYARRARSDAALRPLLAAGIAIAAATMVPRVAIEIAAVNRNLLSDLWPTFAVLMTVPLAAAALAALRRSATAPPHLELSNPLQLHAALGFGALLVALFIVSAGLGRAFGDAGAYAVAAVAGLLDVDAVTITMAESAARGTVATATAEGAIVVALLVNTAVKAAFAVALGGRPLVRSAGAVLALTALAGAVTAYVTIGR